MSSVSTESRSTGGGMTPDAPQASRMLDALASVGAERFDITFTDVGGLKVGFRAERTLDQLRSTIGEIIQRATERRHNVIVRPYATGATLIQLDDLDAAGANRLRPVSFLILHTSPGSYQAWLAVANGNADFARRLRKGSAADPMASGAARVSGSLNFKPKYEPDFPRVETALVNHGLVVTQADVERLGVVAPPRRAEVEEIRVPHRHKVARGWPSYRRCVENAPLAHGEDRPDVSRADFTFCLLAIDWGWSVEATAARLLQESGKARENGEAYADRTARNASAVIEERRDRHR